MRLVHTDLYWHMMAPNEWACNRKSLSLPPSPVSAAIPGRRCTRPPIPPQSRSGPDRRRDVGLRCRLSRNTIPTGGHPIRYGGWCQTDGPYTASRIESPILQGRSVPSKHVLPAGLTSRLQSAATRSPSQAAPAGRRGGSGSRPVARRFQGARHSPPRSDAAPSRRGRAARLWSDGCVQNRRG